MSAYAAKIWRRGSLFVFLSLLEQSYFVNLQQGDIDTYELFNFEREISEVSTAEFSLKDCLLAD